MIGEHTIDKQENEPTESENEYCKFEFYQHFDEMMTASYETVVVGIFVRCTL